MAYRQFSTIGSPRVKEIIEQTVAGEARQQPRSSTRAAKRGFAGLVVDDSIVVADSEQKRSDPWPEPLAQLRSGHIGFLDHVVQDPRRGQVVRGSRVLEQRRDDP